MSRALPTVHSELIPLVSHLRQQARERYFVAYVILLLLIHLPLGLLFQASTIFGTLHALLTLGVGLLFALIDRTPERLIYVVAYITGAELLWRGTETRVFYEFGKYATILLLGLGILKYRLHRSAPKWPGVYFALLIPAIFVLPRFDREAISFNLAGPLALTIGVIFFSSIRFERKHFLRILIAILIPAVSLGGLVIFGIISADTLSFSSGSNFQTSADIGPNQVSAILGLGGMSAFLLAILLNKKNLFLRILMVVISLWLFAQTMLTFSRGGFWTSVGALVIGGVYLYKNPRARTGFLGAAVVIFSLGYFVLLPALDDFTGNALQARFESFETTGRVEIIRADWLTFLMHPVFGVGPNQSKEFHALTWRYASAHTEYSRLLSEHGIFGVFALIILLGVSIDRIVSKGNIWEKAIVVTFTVWTLLFMFHAATRLVAPSLLFGLASARYLIDPSKND